MPNRVHVTSVEYVNYKALSQFTVRLSRVNILVGPNNCGKSTVIGAFRVLALALRKAKSRRSEILSGPNGRANGWQLSDDVLPISIENIHTNYNEADTTVIFRTTSNGLLTLYFPSDGGCILFADGPGGPITSPSDFRGLPLDIQVVPVLGPLEHEEKILTPETVRKNLATTRASRNFRNYWRLNTEGFDEFREMIQRTWPSMDIKPPEIIDNYVTMFCSENRIDRELYWAGFGFQVWCQMLTHLARCEASSLLVIDEPEVYLHPDIQRQLLTMLRDLGPDVLLATHSTEIMSEADPSEILLIDKLKRNGERLRDVEGVQAALRAVGSVQNITLTQLARNRKLMFVEGDSDYRIIRRFAKKLSMDKLAAGTDLTPVPSGGFSSWVRIKALASGFETAIGVGLHVGAVFDHDYWCDEEVAAILSELNEHLEFAHIHTRKEIENYLLVPSALERALSKAIAERERRTGRVSGDGPSVLQLLDHTTRGLKESCQSQYIAKRVDYFASGHQDTSTITADAIRLFENKWGSISTRVEIVPGKQALALLRDKVHEHYSVTLSDYRIVSAFEEAEIPADLRLLLNGLEAFRSSAV